MVNFEKNISGNSAGNDTGNGKSSHMLHKHWQRGLPTLTYVNRCKKLLEHEKEQKQPSPKVTTPQTMSQKSIHKNSSTISELQKGEDKRKDERETAITQQEEKAVPLTVASSNSNTNGKGKINVSENNDNCIIVDGKEEAKTEVKHLLKRLEHLFCEQWPCVTNKINVEDKESKTILILEDKIKLLEETVSRKELYIHNLLKKNEELKLKIRDLNAQLEMKSSPLPSSPLPSSPLPPSPKELATSTQATQQLSTSSQELEEKEANSPLLTTATGSSLASTSLEHPGISATITPKQSSSKKRKKDDFPNKITSYFQEKTSSTKSVPVTPDGASSKRRIFANNTSKLKNIKSNDIVFIDLINESNCEKYDKDDDSSIEVVEQQQQPLLPPSLSPQQISPSNSMLDCPIPKKQKVPEEIVLTKQENSYGENHPNHENNELLDHESLSSYPKEDLHKLCNAIDGMSNADTINFDNESEGCKNNTRMVSFPLNSTSVAARMNSQKAIDQNSEFLRSDVAVKEDDFLKHVSSSEQLKVFRLRMFTNDAKCKEDPKGILPSIWALENGYIACEARILPSEIKTSKEAKQFLLETFPINNTKTSTIVGQKLRRLFEDSISWSDIEWEKSGLQYCTGYMHFAHNLQEGDVVVLIVRGTKKDMKQKNIKPQMVYFGLLADSELIVESVRNLKDFKTKQLWDKTIFKCGRILLRRVKWYRMAKSCDLPFPSESRIGTKYISWLHQNGPTHWISDCTNQGALNKMRTAEFKENTHPFDINKI